MHCIKSTQHVEGNEYYILDFELKCLFYILNKSQFKLFYQTLKRTIIKVINDVFSVLYGRVQITDI